MLVVEPVEVLSVLAYQSLVVADQCLLVPGHCSNVHGVGHVWGNSNHHTHLHTKPCLVPLLSDRKESLGEQPLPYGTIRHRNQGACSQPSLRR